MFLICHFSIDFKFLFSIRTWFEFCNMRIAFLEFAKNCNLGFWSSISLIQHQGNQIWSSLMLKWSGIWRNFNLLICLFFEVPKVCGDSSLQKQFHKFRYDTLYNYVSYKLLHQNFYLRTFPASQTFANNLLNSSV